MSGSPVELIKEKLDVVEFLRGYLTLQPAGKNWKALCPFHKEKTPSFMVSPERQSWRCFGCSVGGDVFTFLMRYENIEFGEALRVLAEKAGVELKRVSPAEYREAGLLHELNERAKEFFRRELVRSPTAQEYLVGRGLTKETTEEFELGWAPNQPETLSMELLNLGYQPADIVRAGLALKTERGLQIDRFRGRIMFPIHNAIGKVVGFTGRILPQFDTGETGKYVNSSESAIFSKSRLLYGLHKSKNFIREAGSAVIVEGQMDFLMTWQSGVKNVVATSGTALTLDHLRAIRRFTDNIVMCFDADEAGIVAGERAIDLAEANDFNVKVLLIGSGSRGFKDPADVAREDPKLLLAMVSDAQPAIEFYFARYLGDFLKGGTGRRLVRVTPEFKRGVRTVLSKIKNVSSAVERSFWIRELGKRSGVDEKALVEEAERIAARPVAEGRAVEEAESAVAKKELSRWEVVSQHLLAACVAHGRFDVVEEVRHTFPEGYGAVAELLKSGKTASSDPAHDELLDSVFLQAGMVLLEDIPLLKSYIEEEYRKERRRALARTLKDAEDRGDELSVEAALEEFKDAM